MNEPWLKEEELQLETAEISPLVVHEILKAMKIKPESIAARMVTPLLRPSARKFTRLLVEFDLASKYSGATGAAGRMLPHFFDDLQVRGTEHTPASGPLILAANHPGGMDFIAIAARAGRDDLKVITSDVGFLQALPHGQKFMIPLPNDARARFGALKEAIRHLENDGTLLLFPTGSIDPDPHYFANAAAHIERWSQSLEVFTRKVPQVNIQPIISSHAIRERLLFNNLLVQRQKTRVDRQRLAEFLQVMQMVLLRGEQFHLKINFGEALRLAEGESPEDFYARVKHSAHALLAEHCGLYPPARQAVWAEQKAHFRS